MMAVLFGIAVLVWLVAAYAFVRLAAGWLAVYRKAGQGQGVSAAFELGTLNFAAVERRLGVEAAPIVTSFRRHAAIFAGCVGVFMVLLLINIVSGNAA